MAALAPAALLYGQTASGVLRGVTKGSAGLPVPEARGVAHNVGENSDRAVLSGADGTFVMEGLKAGRYQLTASKPGWATSSGVAVELASGQSLNVEITLAVPAQPPGF